MIHVTSITVLVQEMHFAQQENALDILARLQQLNKPRSPGKGNRLKISPTWDWPEGYTPPEAILRDHVKMGMMEELQAELDKLNARELASKSYWDLNKKGILRYLEGKSSVLSRDLYGVMLHWSNDTDGKLQRRNGRIRFAINPFTSQLWKRSSGASATPCQSPTGRSCTRASPVAACLYMETRGMGLLLFTVICASSSSMTQRQTCFALCICSNGPFRCWRHN
jgi:hypothetical protein